MMDYDDVATLQAMMHGLTGTDEQFTFYYDESNNVRKLHLNATGLNVADPSCFVLGGIVHAGPPRPLGLDALRPLLFLQDNVSELKLKHLARGSFLDHLKSDKLETALRWIGDQGLHVHYQVTDPVYWSVVDIIDSIGIVGELGLGMLQVRDLKDTLYALLRDDLGELAALMLRHDYPNVGDGQRAFLDELIALVEVRLDACDDRDLLDHHRHMMLKGILQAGRKAPLVFLKDEAPRMLLEEFGVFYANRMQTFPRSEHILDDEHLVRRYLESGALSALQPTYRFVNSKDEEGVQISDVVVGLLGKAFTYCVHTPVERIESDIAGLSDQQSRTLATLSRLLDRSADANAAFAFRILADEDERRSWLLLDPERPVVHSGPCPATPE